MNLFLKRAIDIIASVPNNFFDNLKPTEIILKLTSEYLKRYGEDETTIIPGTKKHLNCEILKELLENKNYKEV